MIRHIVMWSLLDHAEGADKPDNVDKAARLLRSFAQLVPGIREFEVATAQAGWDCTNDLVLNMLVDLSLIHI